ncbi:hypothetical protein GCM10007216_18560 [Thalassobacillus devorans]|uniref:Uncharacterized protein n=1 Tax=Thalassobacillus devorans TaxID=279813 RepID=A0ABQ1NZM0_9BACI|nr:hypothetical protein [Thalassobacillus devorans]NIK28201.1 hypothetical protein [Thalassobacillus devorans]GGC88098.1 hypothetical protein GCM10007216_18560 [Thalassobacillus devorans]
MPFRFYLNSRNAKVGDYVQEISSGDIYKVARVDQSGNALIEIELNNETGQIEHIFLPSNLYWVLEKEDS